MTEDDRTFIARAIAIRQSMRVEAVEVWKNYQAKEDKIQY
jgi:hypothetical protein